MFERVSKVKNSLRLAANRIDTQNAAASTEYRKQKQLGGECQLNGGDIFTTSAEKGKRYQHETERKQAAKLGDKFHKLENLRLEVMDCRSEKRRKLKWMVRCQKKMSNKSKREAEETPTQILNNYYNDDKDGSNGSDNGDKDIDDDATAEERDEIQRNSPLQQEHNEDEDEYEHEYEDEHEHEYEDEDEDEEVMTIEQMKLAARAQAAEEIKKASFVINYERAKCAKELEEAKLAKEKDDEQGSEKTESDKNSVEELVGGVQTSTICTLLDCAEEELYDSHFSDSSFDPSTEIVENCPVDTNTLKQTVAEFIQEIEECDTRLSDIKTMQSAILAENATLSGGNVFKMNAEEGLSSHNLDHDGNLSPPMDEPIQRGHFMSRFRGFAERAKPSIKSFRVAAAYLDKERSDKRRLSD